MYGQLHTQPGHVTVYSTIRRIRITVRWLIRRFKRDLRQFDATIGTEARANTRRWVRTVRDRSEAEFRELTDDTRKNYEKAKPVIGLWVDRIREYAESAQHEFGRVIRYGLAAGTLAAVVFGLVWLSGSTQEVIVEDGSSGQQSQVKSPDDGTSFDDWDDYLSGATGRTPNDDRSDSMNPNNDAYDAAMDNHANQMNPNNDAYWSSRGR